MAVFSAQSLKAVIKVLARLCSYLGFWVLFLIHMIVAGLTSLLWWNEVSQLAISQGLL